jgi:hypothetical protein
MYTLDFYSSTVWFGVMRCREAHSDVPYPTAIDDEMFEDPCFRAMQQILHLSSDQVEAKSVHRYRPRAGSVVGTSPHISIMFWNMLLTIFELESQIEAE